MPRVMRAALAECPNAGCPRPRDVVLTYDTANDQYFVACLACGTEGSRIRGTKGRAGETADRADERQAKILWRKRIGITYRNDYDDDERGNPSIDSPGD